MAFSNFVQELLLYSYKMQKEMMENKKPNNSKMFWQPWLDNSDDTTKKQSMKWKRDRRSRLPEYSRKSDPKIAETFSSDQSSPSNADSSNGSGSPNGFSYGGSSPEQQNGVNKSPTTLDAPLDMSVRQRGQPPSYSQTINNPGYRSTYKPTIKNNGQRDNKVPSEGVSMCDPIIDEHFRRSLGSDYHILFSNNNVPKETKPTTTTTTTTKTVSNKLKNSTNNKESSSNAATTEFMENTGLSVDDHFAKALGDTWVKLNKNKEPDIKNGTSESLVSI